MEHPEQLVPDAATAAAVPAHEEESASVTAVPAETATPTKETTRAATSARANGGSAAAAAIAPEPKRSGRMRLPLHLLTGKLRRVLLWEDVVLTVSWLSGLFSAVYLLFFNQSSLLYFSAIIVLAAVLANLFYVNAYGAYCSIKHQPYEHPHKRSLDRGGIATVDKEWVLVQAGAAVDELNRQLVTLSRIVYCEDSMTSFKAAGVLYVIATVGNALPTGWLCVIALVVAFTGPVIYAQRHADVDRVITLAETQANAAATAANAKVRPYLNRVPFLKAKPE